MDHTDVGQDILHPEAQLVSAEAGAQADLRSKNISTHTEVASDDMTDSAAYILLLLPIEGIVGMLGNDFVVEDIQGTDIGRSAPQCVYNACEELDHEGCGFDVGLRSGV